MTGRRKVEPGSPVPLHVFHASFRAGAIRAAGLGHDPTALAANSSKVDQPRLGELVIKGTPRPVSEFLGEVIVDWIEVSEASQIGVSLPHHGGVSDGLILLTIDETGYIAEHATFSADEPRRVGLSAQREPMAVRGVAGTARAQRGLPRLRQMVLPRLREHRHRRSGPHPEPLRVLRL